MRRLLMFSFLFVGCASIYSPDVWDSETNSKVHTLRLYTGSRGSSLYQDNFEKKADKICPFGYKVLDKTYTPNTIHKKLHDGTHFTWVIECI